MNEPEDRIEASEEDKNDHGWPWSFIFLVVAGGLYLVFRFIDLAIKLFD